MISLALLAKPARTYLYLCLLILAFLCQGCYGIRFRQANTKNVEAFLKAYPHTRSIIADSSYFDNLFEYCEAEEAKNLYQPLQVHYIYEGRIQASLLNCMAKPRLFNLNWNDAGRLDNFPARTHIQPPLCLDPLVKLTGQTLDEPDTWYVLVFWCLSTKKLSRKLFSSLMQHQHKKSPRKTEWIFINLDVMFQP
jgi:hypothetical protein